MGHVDIARVLIAHGANVNHSSDREDRPLFTAIQKNRIVIGELLLQHGASFHLTNPEGRTPLLLAAELGHTDVARLLIQYGADADQVVREGMFALLLAAQEGMLEIVRVLVEMGATVDRAHGSGSTALIEAATSGFTEVVKFLLGHGADTKRVDNDGKTALYEAARGGHLECCQLLIQAGADIEHESEDSSVLLAALESLNPRVVSLLIEHGVNVNPQLPESPLEIVLDWGYFAEAATLVIAGADVSGFEEHPVPKQILRPLKAIEAAFTKTDSPIQAFHELATSCDIFDFDLLITLSYMARRQAQVDIFSYPEIQTALREQAGGRDLSIASVSAVLGGLATLGCSDMNVHYFVAPYIQRGDSDSLDRLLRVIRFLTNDIPSVADRDALIQSAGPLLNSMIQRSSAIGLGPVIAAILAVFEKRARHLTALSKVESMGGLRLHNDMVSLVHDFIKGSFLDTLEGAAFRELSQAIQNHYELVSVKGGKRPRDEIPELTTPSPKRTAAPDDFSS